MTDQQGGAPGQPGGSTARDQEGTQVGMPVPPATPGYSQQPPQAYGQPPGGASSGAPTGYAGQAPGYPPPPPGYGGQPPGYGGQPAGYGTPPGGYPPAGYPYQTPPPKRGVSPLLIGLFALLLVLALGVGGMYAFGLGPFAPSATPTAAAQATPTPSGPPATATPAEATPSPTPTAAPETTAPATTAPATTAPVTLPPITLPPITLPPTTSPGADEAALLLHVPEEFRDTCNTSLVIDGLASVTCTSGDLTAGDAIFVKYSQYADLETMQAEYDLKVAAFGPDASDGDCAVADNWPSNSGYTISDVHAGSVLCIDFINQPQMYWTDERLNILSWSFPGSDITKEEMHAFWANDAGPNELP